MATTATNQQQLSFLQDKIKEIGSAIFFNLSDSVLKLPTSIVSTIRVDDMGYVWFFVQRPKQSIQEFETEFPVRLEFYKKGKSYFLQVSGKGWVVSDPEEVNATFNFAEQSPEVNSQMLLVKVKIMRAEYFETRTAAAKTSWWQSAVSSITTWFRHSNNFRPDVYYPVS